MNQVAVLGGGPAGAFAAAQLASAGLRTVVLDEKLAWEKPCGGGLTYKAYTQYPFLAQNDTPKKFITETRLAAPRAGEISLTLDHPLVIYSRLDLNRLLLERATQAGAQLEQDARPEHHPLWPRLEHANQDRRHRQRITASSPPARAIRCANSAPRSPRGYHVRPRLLRPRRSQDHIDIQFLPGLEGYIWVFPRCGHLSVGICGKGEPAQSLRARLELYMDQQRHLRAMARPSTATCCLLWIPRPGSRTAWRAKAGWPSAMPPAWSIPSPVKACITRCAPPTSPRKPCCRRATAAPMPPIAVPLRRDFAGDLEFGSRLAQPHFPGPLSPRFRPQPHGPIHAPQPHLQIRHPGSFRRHSNLYRA